jgi:hypothetical protein
MEHPASGMIWLLPIVFLSRYSPGDVAGVDWRPVLFGNSINAAYTMPPLGGATKLG